MSNPQPTHRSLTGIVTKLVGDGATYGFINDEIFFPQTNVAGGGPASVGDQVFAECEYSAQLPIKWNATSVKILNKAPVGGQTQANNPPDRAQQDLMNPQQQFNQASPVAVTYQQHRQQRQQRLDTDNRPHIDSKPVLQQPPVNEPPARLLDQNQGDFFAPGVMGPFQIQNQPQMQQQDGGIPPFQNQPMEGPNFTYTSQPGSAFVQNQFLRSPFITQPAPPMLPQSQQVPQNNQLPINHNQRNNSHNKGAGNRFNSNMDKNDRQQNRNRNQARNNDNKFDRMRSGDREGHNDRSRGNNSSRDRSMVKSGKRDGSSRPSPPANSSARSTTSSDRGAKGSRRHYEPQNIPKTQIMTNMNAFNMKQRCPTSIHVPSDLKDIIVNKYFRLDVKNTPKPLRFIIEETESGKTTTKQDEALKESAEGNAKDTTSQQSDDKSADMPANGDAESSSTNNQTADRADIKTQEQPTPPSSKSDMRLNHKYGVKVILLSMPEFDAIYRKVFGPDLDSFTNDTKPRSRLDDAISLLCNKGSNNGHSLIGGKFDPVLDGFVEGKNNRLERHGRHPDLIATCKRVVLEQTGLDLAPCMSWNLLATFLYNNKSDYFSSKASVEYSFVYMPQIWTMLRDSLDLKLPANLTESEIPIQDDQPNLNEIGQENSVSKNSEDVATLIDQEETKTEEVKKGEIEEKEEKDMEVDDIEIDTKKIVLQPATQESSLETPSSSFDTSNIYEMKRDDLKLELDKRDIKYKMNAKKSELLSLLEDALKREKDSGAAPDLVPGQTNDSVQLEEGEVENVASDDSDDSECKESAPELDSEESKRKAEDVKEPSSKRVCMEQGSDGAKPAEKDKRVELINEAFFVKSREEQQLSLVTLYDASQVSRHDQFELSVASNILKESLIQHLSEYILTTLVEDNRAGSANSSNQNLQESIDNASSDTNNNTPKTATSKNLSQSDSKLVSKEYPINRYINLAFSYFDSTHMGYVYADDLNKLFNNTNLTLSKRALSSLLKDVEKFNYRTLPDLSPNLHPTYIYEFPEQFRQLPDGDNPDSSLTSKMIQYKGVMYDLDKLTQEVRDAETLRVSMVDRFNYAIENADKQAEEIHVLEVSQKSLSKAIKSQNEEISDLKRERDSIKKKFETLRKGIKGSVSSLSDLLKEDK